MARKNKVPLHIENPRTMRDVKAVVDTKDIIYQDRQEEADSFSHTDPSNKHTRPGAGSWEGRPCGHEVSSHQLLIIPVSSSQGFCFVWSIGLGGSFACELGWE